MTGFEPAAPTTLKWCANRAAPHPERDTNLNGYLSLVKRVEDFCLEYSLIHVEANRLKGSDNNMIKRIIPGFHSLNPDKFNVFRYFISICLCFSFGTLKP